MTQELYQKREGTLGRQASMPQKEKAELALRLKTEVGNHLTQIDLLKYNKHDRRRNHRASTFIV
jgi:hypothetical protein